MGATGARRWGRWSGAACAPLPLSFSLLEGGGGAGARARRGGGTWYPMLWGGGALDGPRPPSHSRNWGNGVGDGAVQENASASPSPFSRSLPPLPVGLCLGNLGSSIPHSRKRDFAGAYFIKFEFQGAGGWEAEDGRKHFSLICPYRPDEWYGEKTLIPCSFGAGLLKRGCHPEKTSSSRRTPTIQTPNLGTVDAGLGKFPTWAPSPSPAPPPRV